MESVQRLNNLTQRVEYTLQKYPNTRNSDLELQAQLCTQFYPPMESPIWNWRDFVSVMRSLPTLDHIARARRKVIQQHKYKKYLPTDPMIAKARGINEEVWIEYSKQDYITTGIKAITGSNYPPDIQDKLERTGQTGIDD